MQYNANAAYYESQDGRSNVKVAQPPGGVSSISLGWSNEPTPYPQNRNRRRKQKNQENSFRKIGEKQLMATISENRQPYRGISFDSYAPEYYQPLYTPSKQEFKNYVHSPYTYEYSPMHRPQQPHDSAIEEQIKAINFGLSDPRLKDYLLSPTQQAGSTRPALDRNVEGRVSQQPRPKQTHPPLLTSNNTYGSSYGQSYSAAQSQPGHLRRKKNYGKYSVEEIDVALGNQYAGRKPTLHQQEPQPRPPAQQPHQSYSREDDFLHWSTSDNPHSRQNRLATLEGGQQREKPGNSSGGKLSYLFG